jgi:hypothetical protein
MGDFSLGKLSALPQKEAAIILTDKEVQERRNGIPVFARTAHDFVDSSDVPTKVTGYCECFNLKNPEERATYADLCAKFVSSENIEKVFEQHVIDEGALFVYVTYLEYIKVVEEQNYERN